MKDIGNRYPNKGKEGYKSLGDLILKEEAGVVNTLDK